jgi:molecular chaperone DnaK (HSP70)
MSSIPVIGIDLGTSYSRVAVWKDDKVEVISDAQGSRNILHQLGDFGW